ncbi:MAG TPA: Ldh family oxidoreductase [Candidatus Methylomirabilis sp.]|nr:Ldh family oxidoreductase [Candidatus Methylomirabilis sp.]
MPTLRPEPLETLARDIFQAITVPLAGAAWMAQLLVRANLRGHDSHGVIRVPQYVASWKKGEANPTADPVVIQEGPATALIDGKRGFGQIVARRGMEVAMEKAAAIGISAVGVFNSNHIGRLADYTEMASERNMLALLAVNAGGAGQRMAPWGGRAARLSTNPIAFACPTGRDVPISFDVATTVAAEGKVRVKRNRKEPIPSGWCLDAQGNPTTDPNAIYGNPPGTILPMGGHKGYSLALMIEILAGIVGRGGYSRENPGPILNGMFMVVVDLQRFVEPGTFRREVDDLIRYLKTSPTVPGVDQILAPGEPEAITEAKRRAAGIFVEEQTWGQIAEVAREFGLALPTA